MQKKRNQFNYLNFSDKKLETPGRKGAKVQIIRTKRVQYDAACATRSVQGSGQRNSYQIHGQPRECDEKGKIELSGRSRKQLK